MKKCYIVLENGRVFEGLRFGAEAPALGEMVFTTGVVGYLETLTDPSYYGQIVMQTFPSIGNYGVIEEDFEGTTQAAGYVVRDWCDTPSNFRSQYDIDTFLKRRGIPGVYGVDTREITRLLRMEGVMNAAIVDEVPEDLSEIKAFRIRDAVKKVSCASGEAFPAEGGKKYKVALIDYGAKHNIIRMLNQRGCEVWELPYDTPAETILSSSANISLGVPDARILPSAMTTRRVARRAISSMLWETMTMVTFSRAWSSSSMVRMRSRPRGSRPAVGSSRIRTDGFMASTPAMATRRI